MLRTSFSRNCVKMTNLVRQCANVIHHVNYGNYMSRSSTLSGRLLKLHNVHYNSINLRQNECSWIGHRQFNTSACYSAKNVKRIIRKPVRVNKKAIKLEVVDIRPGMTMKQLSVILKRSIDQIDEALGFIPGTNSIRDEDQEIGDIVILKEIVRICGFRHNIVSRLKDEIPVEDKDEYPRPPSDPAKLVGRPPVVTVMGHVDHGKTTLLDSLRKTRVVDQEFGGITQHIGAFRVKLPGTSHIITFLDTPGHAAFSAMRGRGARVTDMVILVVAAEDGVMDQTVESIEHAKAAGVPIIVAINKIDRASPARIDVCKRELWEHGVQLEEFGGDVQTVPISALKGTNLLKLQECVLVQAELADLKADVDGMVEAWVIEAKTDPGKGKVATVLVQRGTLEKGDLLVAGKAMAKVRAMFDDGGKAVSKASPSHAVEVLGWKDLPSAGEQILQVKNEQRAREVVDWRISKDKERKALSEREVIDAKMDEHRRQHKQALEERRAAGIRRLRDQQKMRETVTTRDGPQLSIVLKGDVDGSVEALLDTFETYDNNSCSLDLIHFGVGQITETDVEHAAPFSGIVYGFNVTIPASVRDFAEKCGVSVRSYNVIYRLIEDLRRELTSRLPPVEKEEVQGEAEVKQIFTIKEGKQKVDVAGSKCTKGTLSKSGLYRVYRDDELVFEGTARSLRHFKNEVDTVKTNVECGLLLTDMDFKLAPGDVLHCVSSVQIQQELRWQPQGFS